MAGRSQLPVQIMENQTRFDLNAAVENWRNELAAQPNLASDDQRELETHLRDAIAGFQQRGLNDEESFWLARRRVGQPQQLGEEFVKAYPAKVWRERVFWMWLAVFLSSTLGRWAFYFSSMMHENGSSPNTIIGIIIFPMASLIPISVAVLLAKGKLVALSFRLTSLFEKRLRLAIAALLCIALSTSIEITALSALFPKKDIHFPNAAWLGLASAASPISIALLLVSLMPALNRKTPKRA